MRVILFLGVYVLPVALAREEEAVRHLVIHPRLNILSGMLQRLFISLGLAAFLAWMQSAEGALSRDVSIYNASVAVVVAVAAALAGLAVACRKGMPGRIGSVGAAAGAAASIIGIAYVMGAPASELLFALHAAAACPLAVAWGSLLAARPSRERGLPVCVAGALAAAFAFPCIGNAQLLNASALFPAASGLLLAATAKCSTDATADEDTAGDARSPKAARARQTRLFAYALCALMACASLFCGFTASPVAFNSSTSQETMVVITMTGLAVLLAALGAFSAGVGKQHGGTPHDRISAQKQSDEASSRQVIVLQLFVGLASIVFVVGLLLFSAAAAGTMTTSIGIVYGVRQCLVCVCWIIFPQAAAISNENLATEGRLAHLLLASGTLYAFALGSLIDRLCSFTFAQLLVIATACIAFVALLAVTYLTLHMRDLLESQARERRTGEHADGDGEAEGHPEHEDGRVARATDAESGGDVPAVSARTDAEGQAAGAESAGEDDRFPADGSAHAQQDDPTTADTDSLKRLMQSLRLQQVEPYGLTERETQISLLLLDGQTMRGIAEELFITERTVKFHSRNAYEKMGVSSKKELMQKFSNLPPTPAEPPLAPDAKSGGHSS